MQLSTELRSPSRTYRAPDDEEEDARRVPRDISPKFSLAATQGQSTRNNAVAIRVGGWPADRTVSLVGRVGVRWQVDSAGWIPTLGPVRSRRDEVKVGRVGLHSGLWNLGNQTAKFPQTFD